MTVASGATLTVKLIRKRFPMHWLRRPGPSGDPGNQRHGKVFMIAKDLIPEMGTISFVIMKGGRESEVCVIPGAGVTICRVRLGPFMTTDVR